MTRHHHTVHCTLHYMYMYTFVLGAQLQCVQGADVPGTHPRKEKDKKPRKIRIKYA